MRLSGNPTILDCARGGQFYGSISLCGGNRQNVLLMTAVRIRTGIASEIWQKLLLLVAVGASQPVDQQQMPPHKDRCARCFAGAREIVGLALCHRPWGAGLRRKAQEKRGRLRAVLVGFERSTCAARLLRGPLEAIVPGTAGAQVRSQRMPRSPQLP